MLTATNTNGVEFVLNNLQATLQSNTNANVVTALPILMALGKKEALELTNRVKGGTSYLGGTNSASPNTTNAAILLSMLQAGASDLGYAKNGAFYVTTSGTTAVTIPLTNTATNTNGKTGDTVFATWNRIVCYNLSGLDNTNSAAMTIGPAATNGNNLMVTSTNGTANRISLDGGGGVAVLISTNGTTVNAANAAVTVTPTSGGTFAMVISGS